MKHHAFQIGLFTSYMLGMTALMIWQGIGITPDRYSLVLLLGSLLIKKTRKFLLDWVPFIFLLISYDFLRSLVTKLNSRVHYVETFHFDQSLFGQIPTLTLQRMFFTPGFFHWYDYLATIFYLLHFALILIFAFILWFNNRRQFKEFIIGLLLLSYASWITFIIFPSSPPWLASQSGYIPKVTQITLATLGTFFPDKLRLPTVYQNFDPNPIAATPSLHAAYPFLVLLCAVSFFKWRGLIFLPYCLAVWISIVYLGEHYVIDILIGMIYSFVFFLISKFFINHKVLLQKFKLSKKIVPNP